MTDAYEIIERIESQPQRQDSLLDQLRDLHTVATRLGMYDAADWLRQQMNNGAANQIKNPPSQSTWPENCPTCFAPWKVRSKTMGARHGQPHQGCCLNGHWWNEGAS